MEEETFVSQINTQQVSSLYDQLKKNSTSKIILDPPYQRGFVWDDNDMNNFIDSVNRGIVPTTIIINDDQENDERVCIDGRQRLTTILKFLSNDICLTKFKDDDSVEHIYFSEAPDNYEDSEKCKTRVFTNKERAVFNSRQLSVVTYRNLTYDEQLDIFNRIQKGKTLKNGELAATYFTNDSNNLIKLNKLSSRHRDKLDKFYKTERKEDHNMLIKMASYIHNKDVSNPNARAIKKMSSFLNSKKEFGLVIKQIDTFIPIVFGDKLLGNPHISKKKFNNHMVCIICYAFYEHFKKFKDVEKQINDNSKKYIALLKQFSEKVKTEKIKCCTNDGYQILYEFLLEQIDKMTNNKQKIIEESDGESEDDSEADSDEENESDESSDDEIIVQPKPNKKSHKN